MKRAQRQNEDARTVQGFGEEWASFDYVDHSPEELQAVFDQYFSLVRWEELPRGAKAFDVGCGSGRWAKLVAPRVGSLACIDASEAALAVAARNLASAPNCTLHHASVGELPLADDSMDFGYSLGVLHHVPDTAAAVRECVRKLKPGAPFLVYLYYALDNRPAWFRGLWRASDVVRKAVSARPFWLRYGLSQAIAAGVYLPAARASKVMERFGFDVSRVPLSAYRNRSFYVMRTDALDRFGTGLEQRFTREEISDMLRSAGLERISFREEVPFWTAIGYRTESARTA